MGESSRIRSIRCAGSLIAFLAAAPASGFISSSHHRALFIRPRNFMGHAASELYGMANDSEELLLPSQRSVPARRKSVKASSTSRKVVNPSLASRTKDAKASSKGSTVSAATAASSDRSAAAWGVMLDRYKQSSKRGSIYAHEAALDLMAWVDRQRSASIKGKLSKFRTRQLDAASFDWGSAATAVAATNDARSKIGATNAAVAAVANSALVGQTKSSGSKKTKKKGKAVAEAPPLLRASELLWERGFEALLLWKATHGGGTSCRVPNGYAAPAVAAPALNAAPALVAARAVVGPFAGGHDSHVCGGANLTTSDASGSSSAGNYGSSKSSVSSSRSSASGIDNSDANGPSIKLGRWVERQRAAFAAGKLPPAREQRLLAAGFEFSPHAREWDTRVRLLAAFVAQHGHAKVPQAHFVVTTSRAPPKASTVVGNNAVADAAGVSDLTNPEGLGEVEEEVEVIEEVVEEVVMLGTWVATQRLEKKRGKLSPRRIQQLDALGFHWDGWLPTPDVSEAAAAADVNDKGDGSSDSSNRGSDSCGIGSEGKRAGARRSGAHGREVALGR